LCARRRAIQALAPQQDVDWLIGEFTIVREAMDYYAPVRNLLWLSADPEEWLARLAVPGSVLSSAELRNALFAYGTAGGVRQTFKE